MINDSHKCIFIHIPKTAGTSIKKGIGDFKKQYKYHCCGSEIKANYPQKWKDYYKFSFVRNPWDRMYSIFSFYKMGKKISLVDADKLPNDFKTFILNNEKYLNLLGLNYNQVDFIGEEIDFIGRYENLNDDYNFVCNKINIKNPIPLETHRKSNRSNDYKTVYTDNMIDIVGKVFERDIQKFNYKFND